MTVKREKAIIKYDKARLAKNARIGMSKVDPLDIKPPTILLAQALSDFSVLVDTDGQVAKAGEYFHTGKLQILKTFNAYILFAAKGTYIDKRAKPPEERQIYRVLGVMADDFSLFAMSFKVSSLYALSSLFSIANSQKRPMYSFKLTFEVKGLSNEKGDWFVPVCRIKGQEKDPERLILLEDLAKAFDKKGEEVVKQDEGRVTEERIEKDYNEQEDRQF